MAATNKYKRVKLEDITVLEDRQRKKIDTADLEPSISKHGVIQPIIITTDLVLVAGERRFRASQALGLPDIPCRFFEDLSPTEAKIIELEENLKRKDLEWKDETRAIYQIHQLYLSENSEWNQTDTAEAIGISAATLVVYLRVGRELDNPRIASAPGVRPAYNILHRLDDRKLSDTLSGLIEGGAGIFNKKEESQDQSNGEGQDQAEGEAAPPKPPLPPPESLLQVDFLEWAPQYSGRPFNFIHCDFPYGVNLFGGAYGGKNTWKTYADESEDIYWTLCRCLCENLPRIMSESAHLMFWLPADIERQMATLELFRELAPSLDFWHAPLIWHKSCNTGIMQDPKRGPRHIYETALIASRDDRLLAKPVSDTYSAPTDKTHHPSAKPEPMLHYFFQMFVDETTRLLDPTCGGGSALRAAERLGAAQVLGLERDEDFFTAAKSALRSFRALRGATKS